MAGDTIVALSTGSLPSGVAVIRISGPATRTVLDRLAGSVPEPRRAALRPIGAETTLDRGIVLFFPGPSSFTGEDCAELQVHGSRATVSALLRLLSAQPGVRLAAAGEFTRRAFENGKLDLSAVQGLGDLLQAETENQRALAYARLDGALSKQVELWRGALLDLRAEVEAQLDFSDEDDVGVLPADFGARLARLRAELADALAGLGRGRIVRTGFRVVLAGPPNAGKSSLLNALARSDVAIVSDEPGTTRDLKEVPLDLEGQLVLLIDSAGLRDTESRAEALGVARARREMRHADLVLWLSAPDIAPCEPPRMQGSSAEDEPPPMLRIGTKADLGRVGGVELHVSAESGDGLPELLDRILSASGARDGPAAHLLVSHEQDRQALLSACAALDRAGDVAVALELLAEHLRRASAALERLVGRMDAEHVLDRLFSAFCIGK